MTLLAPCIRASGPKDAKIAFVGEAPGEMEETIGLPFVGKARNALQRALRPLTGQAAHT